MSGIVGILNLDRAPIDRRLLRRMTEFMIFRGPDAQEIWTEGHVGFGHTLLKTTDESEHEHQPFTLDGHVWIVADARVDAQRDLIGKLVARGEQVEPGATDVELLLRAYRAWGEECVEHLLGDFAFAVWDGPRQRLFCARDHLGVKPFFYVHLDETVIFSNTLDCIRQHPAVSEKLNDLAIADFLLFDRNQDPATTSFADIQRIPPAHRATWSASGQRMSRYWTLPIDEPIHFKRADDYTERFKELLEIAVHDRLRTNKLAISMSGGMDSPALAATACGILRSRSSDCEVRAFTTVADGIDQNERHYAGLVAEGLGIPIHFRDLSARMIDPHWDRTAIHTSEPVVYPTNLAQYGEIGQFITGYSRVMLYGEGPDNALQYEWKPYLSYLVEKRNFGRLAADVCGHVIRQRRIPLLPTIPRMLRARRERNRWRLPFPDWLNHGFESRMQLRQRWHDMEHPSTPTPTHPWRPAGYRSFQEPIWERFFRSMDAEETQAPLEYRHPFVDLRLLRYMLSLPAIPWCRAKYIERRAMQETLPEAVLRRPKSGLASDVVWEGVRRLGLPPLGAVRELAAYVNSDSVPKDVSPNVGLFRVNFRPFALNYWFRNLRQEPHATRRI
jgi:asparagine synthase (glutamine-hydrolysing)